MNQMAENFEEGFGEVVRSVAADATEWKASAEGMTALAMEMQEKTETVSSASGTSAANVQTVALAAEEFSAAIGGITQLVERSANVA